MPLESIGSVEAASEQAKSFEFKLRAASVHRGGLLFGQISKWACRVQRLFDTATSRIEMKLCECVAAACSGTVGMPAGDQARAESPLEQRGLV